MPRSEAIFDPQKYHAAVSSQSSGDYLPNCDTQKMNYFGIIFVLLVSSMVLRQGKVVVEAKGIARNASAQDAKQKQMSWIQFSQLPPNADTSEINRVQDQNEQYAAE